MHLLEYVRALENKDNVTRGRQVLSILTELEINPIVQQCRCPRLKNIIIDFSSGPGVKRLLFSAHYDAVKGSPGANDNASGVAVLLGLCHNLRHEPAPVRVVFFDREEAWLRTPVLRLGLLGSIYYVCKSDLRNIAAVYNVEFCGLGEFLGIWPIRRGEATLAAVKEVEKAAIRLSVPFRLAHIPWLLLTSDHLPFRLRGVSNALTLSLLPANVIPLLERLSENLSIPRLLVAHRPALPEPLSLIHTARDSSCHLSEKSLQLMLALVLELSRAYK